MVHRFPNRAVRLPDGLHWNVAGLLQEIVEGLRGAGRVDGVGVDAWGVDYGLLDDGGRLLGLPYHHRDARTADMVARAFERVPRDALYAATGIQTMPINTVFQLLADEGTPALAAAARMLLIPDLLAFWLSGEAANEITAASTTGLLDARTGGWAADAIEGLGLPARLFGGSWSSPARRSARCSMPTASPGRRSCAPSRGTTRHRPSPPRRWSTTTPRSSPAEPGRCSGSS